MMIILSIFPNADSFVDDMWIFTETWEDHMTSLRQVLDRLRSAKLMAQPSKCMIRYSSIGHSIVDQTVRPKEDKIQAIQGAPLPTHEKTNGVVPWTGRCLPPFYPNCVFYTLPFDGFN